MTINDIICKLYEKSNNAALIYVTREGKQTTLFDSEVSSIEIEDNEIKVYFECDGV